jgi:hypothetical protein
LAAETALKETKRKMNDMDSRDDAAQNKITSLTDVISVWQGNISDFNKRVCTFFLKTFMYQVKIAN